ncbi:Protein of unknown function [Loktanella fryxellensis]|uniref:DUF2852 domain-containing protein n=1 Tax=Loktanella fryxellensis TaxID=245187 RepID=A0A1H7YAL3_9RHOB|nr:DUF2852 domain-containing protein [Loktanella fryxellensis]SEM43276.1 Protein of unknown function [Loktanella fryxellensis]
MYSTPSYPAASGPMVWLKRTEHWLDARGRGAWIAAMVAGFVVFWPVGAALLAYMIWSKRMFNRTVTTGPSRMSRRFGGSMMQSSGNAAFDAYKEDTLRRLQEEQDSFADFLGRLRAAKDKAEFDQFMADRKTDRPVDDTADAPRDAN